MNNSDWWRGAVIYQIYPRSFADSNNDGIGDLIGIIDKLDYVASLGVDGIWLSPFFKSPMKDFGYDVSDYELVDPIFGTNSDFDKMIEKAHKLNLKIIIDQVLSHTSDQHPWFIESRRREQNDKSDWYVWADPKDDGNPPNNWLSIFGGPAWTYETRRGQYYMNNFLTSQPDLNVRNPEVQDALLDNMKFWLNKGVDGFRLDTANFYMHDDQLRNNPAKRNFVKGNDRSSHPYNWQEHIYDKSRPENLDFIRRLRKLTDEYDNIMMVGEIGDDNNAERSAEYTASPDLLHTTYNFDLLSDTFGTEHIKNSFENFASEPGESWPSWSFSNHDIVRVASRFAKDGNPDDNQIKMLYALICLLKGTPFVYQGEELGLNEADIPFEKLKDPYGIYLYPEDKGRDGCRTPMVWENEVNGGFSETEPWLPVPDTHLERAVSVQEEDSESCLNFVRSFLEFRKNNIELIKGEIEFTYNDENILQFKRSYEGIDLLISFNFNDSSEIIKFDNPQEELFKNNVEFNPSVMETMLKPYGFIITKSLT